MKTRKHRKEYDIIIVGAGIAGLHSAYLLLKEDPSLDILICEKYKTIGGRIQTKHVQFNGKELLFEAGAGRFHTQQHRLMNLIDELGLTSSIQKIDSSFSFYDIHSEPSSVSTKLVVAKLLAYGQLCSTTYLQNHSLLQMANYILTTSETELLVGSFGYYTELVQMNAYDAMSLILNHLNPLLQFCILKGGLSQLIDALKARMPTVTLQCTEILDIQEYSRGFRCISKHNTFFGKKCICALPRPQLQKFKLFSTMSMLNKITCAPLCRIYSVFREPWNKHLPKLTTNNNLRMVITGTTQQGLTTLMTSYTDNQYAKFWKRLYELGNDTFDLVHPELVRLLRETTHLNVPMPLQSYLYYWECGVGYWGIGADSAKIARKMVKPFPTKDLFVCGEHYSATNQQWMEGALETSEQVVMKLLKLNVT